MKSQRFALLALSAVTALGTADAALANHVPGHPCAAAVCQYVEQVPTAGGSKPTSGGRKSVTPLSRSVKQRLYAKAGKDATLLEQVATSSDYGAPQNKPAKPAAPKEKQSKKDRGSETSGDRSELEGAAAAASEDPPSFGKALSASVDVVADGSNGRLIGLVVVLLAITGFALASAGYRARPARQRTGP